MLQNTQEDIEGQIKYAKEILLRISASIGNCDTKAGMVLAAGGVILLLITNNKVVDLFICAYQKIIINSQCVGYIFLFSLFITAIMFIYGLYKFTCAIQANIIVSGYNSKIYFTDIAHKTLPNYKENFKSQTQENVLDDLLTQIHINSEICTKKYSHYNQGLEKIRASIAFMIGIILFSLTVI